MRLLCVRVARVCLGLSYALCSFALGAQPVANEQKAPLLESVGLADVATLQREIMVPMADGARLSTYILLPLDAGSQRLPTVLIRTPYSMTLNLKNNTFIRLLLQNGFAVIIQNERGTQWSEGEFHFLPGVKSDGAQTLTWIAEQRWSNGNVGTYGCSSSAENQLALASEGHPAHKAAIAKSAGAGVGTIAGDSRGLFYKGGVPQIGPWAHWYAVYGQTNRYKLPNHLSAAERVRIIDANPVQPGDPFADQPNALWHLPSQDILNALGAPATDFDRFVRLSPADAAWNASGHMRKGERLKVPMLHVNGWYDVGAYETVKMFENRQDDANQFLIMAPTSHCAMERATEQTRVGEREVGDGRLDYHALYLKWFDHWLKGAKNDVLERPRVTASVMASNRWVNGDRWPLSESKPVTYHLSSAGGANSLFGDGRLAQQPGSTAPWSELRSDPFNPVPSKGAGCCDPSAAQDQRSVEARNDVLVYSTEPLSAPLSVVGDVDATLYVSVDVPDADIAVKLVDVYPDGRAFNLYDTILRLRYRDGVDQPRLLQKDQVYEIKISGLITSNHFAAGHRVRLEVAGSNFPNFERNLHTGGRNFDESKGNVATIRVHQSARYPSRIELPTIALQP